MRLPWSELSPSAKALVVLLLPISIIYCAIVAFGFMLFVVPSILFWVVWQPVHDVLIKPVDWVLDEKRRKNPRPSGSR
jgi:hypothetical protein